MKTIKTKIAAIFLACLLLLLAAPPASAQIVRCGLRSQDTAAPGQQGGCTIQNLFELAYIIVNFLLGMSGFVAIFFIVWGGVRMLLSGGNSSAVQEAKSTVWNAILGLILTLLAYLIVGYVAGLLLPGSGANPIENLRNYLR